MSTDAAIDATTPVRSTATQITSGLEEIKDKGLPRCKKLTGSSDVYGWLKDIELHFEALDLLQYVVEEVPLDTAIRRKQDARCRRDLLHAVEEDLKVIVRHLKTANSMYKTLRKLFLGGKVSELSKLLETVSRLKFEGDYFKFLTSYQSAVTQITMLDTGNRAGYALLSMQFLNKLPRMLGALTHPLKGQVESSTTDNIELWEDIYDKVLNYLIDCGLFMFKKKEVSTGYAATEQGFQTNNKKFDKSDSKKKKFVPTCWNCRKYGHFK